jgi:hypothetical protein
VALLGRADHFESGLLIAVKQKHSIVTQCGAVDPTETSTAKFAVMHKRAPPECDSLVAHYRLPAVYPYRQFAEFGGLLSYGNDLRDNYRRAATYTDRILREIRRRTRVVGAFGITA